MSATAKFLVVDDDPVITKSFDRVLSRMGYAVIAAIVGIDNKVGRAVAAPFIGLAYIGFPVVVMFVSFGLRAWISARAGA